MPMQKTAKGKCVLQSRLGESLRKVAITSNPEVGEVFVAAPLCE